MFSNAVKKNLKPQRNYLDIISIDVIIATVCLQDNSRMVIFLKVNKKLSSIPIAFMLVYMLYAFKYFKMFYLNSS